MKRKISIEEFGHIPRKVGPTVQRRISALGIGQRMQDLPEELWHPSFKQYMEDDTRNGGPNLRIIRLDPQKPALTVTGYIFNKFVHPTEDRYITPREAARLQGFPDSFLFKGTLTSIQRQIGNAVPVQLAHAVAESILRNISEYHPSGIAKEIYCHRSIPVLSLFSGAGGMDVGFEAAQFNNLRFQVKKSIEYDRDCCSTLVENIQDQDRVIEADIRTLDPKNLAESMELENGLLPLLIGGPPCQSFSQAGKQLGVNDDRGNLVWDYFRFVEALKPTYFVMENVSNLKGISKGALLRAIYQKISELGYNYSSNVLCAADYGAAQFRKRLIIVGVRKPYIQVPPPLPSHGAKEAPLFDDVKPYVCVGEAFRGLPKVSSVDYDFEIAK